MSQNRRRDIIDVARRRALTLVEDDLYGAYAMDMNLTPLAKIAPERVFYATSLSKTIAPGLRAGYLIAPSAAHEQALDALHASALCAAPLGHALASRWIMDGLAAEVLTQTRGEMAARQAMALEILGAAMERAPAMGLHAWLPMSELAAERAAARLLRDGVEVTPPGDMLLDAATISGVRLCLGAAPDREALDRGLRAVKAALSDRPSARRDIV
jgi:DNA-binding transcriptional MocR family regulator